MNIIHDPWIPVRCRSGRRDLIAPTQLLDDLDNDPATRLASCRPDFDGGIAQLLIGLAQLVLPPDDEWEWADRYDTPPSPDEWRAALDNVAHAFELLGDGPRFFQDLDLTDEDGTELSVEKLLLDRGMSPGSDQFVRNGSVEAMCAACVATALSTFQLSAPSGGRGHRTSMRGGGPLTTLVRPRSEGTLWDLIWANVLPTDHRALRNGGEAIDGLEHKLPWLASHRTSRGGAETTPLDVHPLQMYFSTPRRIRLTESEETGTCELCGRGGVSLLRTYRQKDLGVNYSDTFVHPLTPYRRDQDQLLSIKGFARTPSYRDWLALVLSGSNTVPAAVVSQWSQERCTIDRGHQNTVWLFGHAFNNMKPLAWSESEVPLFAEEARELRERLIDEATRYVEGAQQAHIALSVAVKKLIRKNPKGVSAPLDVSRAFWESTEAPFRRAVADVHRVLGEVEGDNHKAATELLRLDWLDKLKDACRSAFEARLAGLDLRAADPRQIAEAEDGLRRSLAGKKQLAALGLTPDRAKQLRELRTTQLEEAPA